MIRDDNNKKHGMQTIKKYGDSTRCLSKDKSCVKYHIRRSEIFMKKKKKKPVLCIWSVPQEKRPYNKLMIAFKPHKE